ncbi:uncharacterized protein LOC120429922 [Culex pipiens pallens]|uniref:uncharacterized protein LOC120429922 n=1 Tax=Culex pipiens pallens TaxID=42434 RepID=UPI001953C5B8|nr:uncharacterized protein LOC120429922 [Culex pipiens pallens]
MKGFIALLLFAVVNGSPYHPFYHGYNPYTAWSPFNWYNPFVAPAPPVPFSGTYSYHDGHKPTVVQANNDGFKFPHGAPPAAVPVPVSGTYAFHDGHRPTVVQANNGGHKLAQALVAAPPPVPAVAPAPISGTYVFHDGHRPTVVQANNEGYKFPGAAKNLYASWNHPWNPWSVVAAVNAAYQVPTVPVQKTVVQANLGSVDPWKYGTFYGTGLYGYGFSNYLPASPVVIG